LEDFSENIYKEKSIKELLDLSGLHYKKINWCPCCFVKLDGNYQNNVSKKVLRGYKTRKNRLQDDYGKYLIIDGKESDLNLHFDLHQRRFKNSWSGGSYASDNTRLFMRRVCTYLSNNNMLHFKILILNGEHVASILGGELNKKIFIYTAALDVKFNEYGLGKMLYIEDILKSEKTDFKEYDLMRGNEKYKKEIGCEERMNYKIIVAKTEENISKYRTYYKDFSKNFGFEPSMF
jgi:CelD/BcsL family acetyltransferase involved in cellulose biosynthesis